MLRGVDPFALAAWLLFGSIAFCSNRSGNNEIHVMNRDGSGLMRVTNASASDILPSSCPLMTHASDTC